MAVPVTDPEGTGVTVVYAAAMSLIIASRFGPIGWATWALFWGVLTYRATSSRRNSGGEQTIGEVTSDACSQSLS